MIRLATYSDIPALKHIRKVCFGEDDLFLTFYFSTRFTEHNTLLYVAEDKAVASLTMLDAELVTPGGLFPVSYIYAVATLPEWRRKGLAAALSQYADQHLQERGVKASILVPASAALFDYYAGLGYDSRFFIEKQVAPRMRRDSESLLQVSDLTADEYFRLRGKAFAAGGYYVQWDLPALDYALQECRFGGGVAWYIRLEQEEGFLLAYPVENSTIVIKESWLSDRLRAIVYAILSDAFGAQFSYVFYTSSTPRSKTAVPFGMMKNYSQDVVPAPLAIPYFGLAKD